MMPLESAAMGKRIYSFPHLNPQANQIIDEVIYSVSNWEKTAKELDIEKTKIAKISKNIRLNIK